MKYLVLGSSGQIGSPLVQYLQNKGHSVVEYDIKRNYYEDLRLFEPYKSLKAYILESYICQCDFIFFLAWDIGGSKYLSSNESTFDFVHNNVAIMDSTFYFIKKYNKPFIFTSSQMASMDHSTYGNTKLIGEKLSNSLGGISVRLWNVYGYEEVSERSHVITDFIWMGLNNGVIDMRTNGEETRQFLYVEDCCDALFILSKLYDNISRDQDFHISSYVWTSIEDIAKIVSNLCNCTYIKSNLIDNVQMSIQEEPNNEMLKYWNPKVSINEGIKCVMKRMKNF